MFVLTKTIPTICAMRKAVSSPPTVTLTVSGLHFGHWTYEPGEVYVQLCNSRDPYEFGFNGQMKTNEIAGVGNHYDLV